MSGIVPKPTFLILGAAKSGTTSLFHMLSRHPEVYFSVPKEPVFFELEYDRGLDYYASAYLEDWSGQKAIGEGRVYNLYLPYVPARVHASLPDAKLIAILRNPVDRAYSHWWHRVTRGYERRSFEAVISGELERLERDEHFPLRESEQLWRRNFHPNATGSRSLDLKQVPLVEMGYYAEQLRRYRELFPLSRIVVFLFEDLTERPEWIIRRLCDLLEIEHQESLAEEPPSNVAQERVKSPLAFHIERLSWSLGVAGAIPKPVRSWIRKLFPAQAAKRPGMAEATRRRLTAHFQAANDELGSLIGRDLSDWCESTPAGRSTS